MCNVKHLEAARGHFFSDFNCIHPCILLGRLKNTYISSDLVADGFLKSEFTTCESKQQFFQHTEYLSRWNPPGLRPLPNIICLMHQWRPKPSDRHCIITFKDDSVAVVMIPEMVL